MSYYEELCNEVPERHRANTALMDYISAISEEMEKHKRRGSSDDMIDRMFKDAMAHVRCTVFYTDKMRVAE